MGPFWGFLCAALCALVGWWDWSAPHQVSACESPVLRVERFIDSYVHLARDPRIGRYTFIIRREKNTCEVLCDCYDSAWCGLYDVLGRREIVILGANVHLKLKPFS